MSVPGLPAQLADPALQAHPTPPPRSRSSARSSSRSSSSSSSDSSGFSRKLEHRAQPWNGRRFKDAFPFEQNLFELGVRYAFQRRIYTNIEVVVYRARVRQTGQLVAVKILDYFDG
jgi:hypothetical protein